MRNFNFLATALLFVASIAQSRPYDGRVVKVLVDETGESSVISDQAFESDDEVLLQEESYPQFIREHEAVSGSKIIELRSTDSRSIDRRLAFYRASRYSQLNQSEPDSLADEVRTLVNSGPASNRIDLVFMGDGYTASERDKFFSDMDRLVKDMFVGQTFTAYLPLFNVHAVFRPSNTSGIGRGSARDTAYGLYREGATLRAIFPGKPSAIRSSCGVAPGCDYPVVIANDPYYGGLGGEFAISTSSPTSGTVVLRHELGHNFGRVGEEYDGGGYFGANHSSSTNVSWAHWATEARVRAQPAYARFIKWPWHKLDKGPFVATFNSDGNQANGWIRFSASGIETDDTLQIKLDGERLAFTSPNRADRSFIKIPIPALSAGKHRLEFSEHVNDHNNWLSDLNVFEYRSDFNNEEGFIGAYPVFTENLKVAGYRPTNEMCLMRNMQSRFFCPVCQENNWLKFFARISLIDSLKATTQEDTVSVTLKPLELGQFRSNGTGPVGESLDIRWFQGSVELVDLAGQTTWSKARASLGEEIEVRVKLKSSQIRAKDIQAKKSIKIQ